MTVIRFPGAQASREAYRASKDSHERTMRMAAIIIFVSVLSFIWAVLLTSCVWWAFVFGF